jgi:hypothetical protein
MRVEASAIWPLSPRAARAAMLGTFTDTTRVDAARLSYGGKHPGQQK